MTKIPKDGLRPSPVYEAHMSDGEVVRLSFYTPAGKPINMEAGRRAVEAIACGLPVSETIRQPITLGEYLNRPKSGGVYTVVGMDRPYTVHREIISPAYPFVRDASGAFCRPVPRDPTKRVLRGFVEHPTIGRVEHVPGHVAAPARRARVKSGSRAAPLSDRARAFAIMLVDEFSHDQVDAQAVAQAVIGLREALR